MIYFLIPVYNEKENIPNLHRELKSILLGEEKFYVFYNDGSTDGSDEEIRRCFEGERCVILGSRINQGPGVAFNNGFEWILRHSGSADDKIVTLEADCTSDLKILPNMIAISRLGYELVLASVYAQGGSFDSTTFFRRLLSSIANTIFRFLFDVKVLTLSSFYRVYSIVLLRKIKDYYGVIIEEKGFICMLEVLLKAISLKAPMIEVPMVLYSKKRIGKSKMRKFKTTLQYFKFLIYNYNKFKHVDKG